MIAMLFPIQRRCMVLFLPNDQGPTLLLDGRGFELNGETHF